MKKSKIDLQQVKTMKVPSSAPATAIVYEQNKKMVGSKTSKQTIKDAK